MFCVLYVCANNFQFFEKPSRVLFVSGVFMSDFCCFLI